MLGIWQGWSKAISAAARLRVISRLASITAEATTKSLARITTQTFGEQRLTKLLHNVCSSGVHAAKACPNRDDKHPKKHPVVTPLREEAEAQRLGSEEFQSTDQAS